MCIAPVNQAFCALVTLIEEGVDSEAFQRLQYRFKDALFHGPQGMTIMGTNGVQTWDCAFAIQYFSSQASQKDLNSITQLSLPINSCVMLNLTPSAFQVVIGIRERGLGASTKTQGYTVADCTAEAIKAIIMVKNSPVFSEVHHMISSERLFEGIDVLLNLQNIGSFEYGSFATYEKSRPH